MVQINAEQIELTKRQISSLTSLLVSVRKSFTHFACLCLFAKWTLKSNYKQTKAMICRIEWSPYDFCLKQINCSTWRATVTETTFEANTQTKYTTAYEFSTVLKWKKTKQQYSTFMLRTKSNGMNDEQFCVDNLGNINSTHSRLATHLSITTHSASRCCCWASYILCKVVFCCDAHLWEYCRDSLKCVRVVCELCAREIASLKRAQIDMAPSDQAEAKSAKMAFATNNKLVWPPNTRQSVGQVDRLVSYVA